MIIANLYKELGKIFWYTGTIIGCTLWLEDKFATQSARDYIQEQRISALETDVNYIKDGKLKIGSTEQSSNNKQGNGTILNKHLFVGDRKKEIIFKNNKIWVA